MSVKNFVQCGLVTPVAANTVELVLVAPTASYQYPPLDGGTLVIADSVARPTFYEIISYTHRIDNVLYGVVRAKEGTTARTWMGSTWVYQALTAQDYVDALALKAPLASPALTGVPTAPTAPLGTNTQQIATMAAVQAAIANLIASSPAALDTLNELAAALGNDPNFATTINNALAGKEPSIAAGTSAQMWLGNKTWASVLTQVQNTLLTGLEAGSNATILTTDTLIGALAKIQNQLNNKANFTDPRLSDAREWTATEVTQAEAKAGTATIARKWTAQRVWQAVLASSLTGLNLTVNTAVAASDTVLVAIGKLQKQISDAAANLAGNVRATVLTGYVTGSAATLSATDTVLTAFGKVQAQLDAKQATLTGLIATVAELNYTDGVTSNIQTQLNNKAAADHTHNYWLPDTAIDGWFRSNGSAGWYSQTYGGGIYMTDTAYVRTYGGKGFYCAGNEIVLEGPNPTLRLYDNNWGNRSLHSNDGYIGFLTSGNAWAVRAGNDRSIEAGGAVRFGEFGRGQLFHEIDGNGNRILRLNNWDGGGVNVLNAVGSFFAFGPISDNNHQCGWALARWSNIWSVNGAIQTSDAREKTAVRPLTSAELSVAKQIASEIGVYQWLEAVEKKGADVARLHPGQTVQRIMTIMELHGLDPFAYGFVCFDEWEAVPPVYEDDGVTIKVAGQEAGNRYSMRYDELNVFMARGLVQRQDELEARIAALEGGA